MNQTALRNVDVTVVYPLPAPGEQQKMMGPSDAGNGGALLPLEVFEDGGVPELDQRSPLSGDAERLAALRVVAVRFDPCPGELAPPPAGTVCQPGIRLVFQSLAEDATGVFARDGAVHASYRVTADEFEAVLEELRDIRSEHATDPETRLDVHPLLQSTGLDGAYATRLAALVTKFAGPATLTRITSFSRTEDIPDLVAVRWTFTIKEKVGSAWKNVEIATTGVTEQDLVTIVSGRWSAIITPPVTHSDDAVKALEAPDPEARAAGATAVVHLLNPRIHSSETVDCATCHIAPDVASFISLIDIDLSEHPDRFISRYSLEAATKSSGDAVSFDNMHMLSYFGKSLNVSPRVANETAAVLEAINGG